MAKEVKRSLRVVLLAASESDSAKPTKLQQHTSAFHQPLLCFNCSFQVPAMAKMAIMLLLYIFPSVAFLHADVIIYMMCAGMRPA